MSKMPRDKAPDSTVAVLLDGNTFILKRRKRLKSDVFETRLQLQKTICMGGEEAARLFYDESRFKRKGAAPIRLKETLFGRGGVQELDGKAHRQRKAMFMSLMTEESVRRLVALAEAQWRAYIPRWQKLDRVVLFDEVAEILCRAVCAWTAVPLKEQEVKRRTEELAAMFEGAGAVVLRHIQGRLARNSSEGWIEGLVEQVRGHRLEVPGDSGLHVAAWHRELDGNLLDRHVAAVEVINLLRPTVAVARFITFVAHALHEHPECRQKLLADEGDYSELFVQEVRRYYPFFPFTNARVRRDFEWKGYRFSKGARVLLDLYGTDHDAKTWKDPEVFRPERFLEWDGSPYNFIPQGGGDYDVHHRCPGERITIELMKLAARMLVREMAYEVPEQNLSIKMWKMPAIPESRFVMSNVRPTT